MSAVELLWKVAGVNARKVSRLEIEMIEVELFARLCHELIKIFKDKLGENLMQEGVVRCLINDMLSTKEYTLTGIAHYTHTPEDVIFEIAAGLNTSPSLEISRKIIELHRSVRRELYLEIMRRITVPEMEYDCAV